VQAPLSWQQFISLGLCFKYRPSVDVSLCFFTVYLFCSYWSCWVANVDWCSIEVLFSIFMLVSLFGPISIVAPLICIERPRAQEAVWQVWRPPYQSKIWYGDAIPIKSKAANLFIICNKSRIKHLLFYMFLSHEFWAVTEVAKIQSTRTGLK